MEPVGPDDGAARLPCRRVADVADRARALLRAGTPVILELTSDDDTALATVDELARLVLESRRGGTPLRVVAPGHALRLLAELAGLCDVLRIGPADLAADPAAERVDGRRPAARQASTVRRMVDPQRQG